VFAKNRLYRLILTSFLIPPPASRVFLKCRPCQLFWGLPVVVRFGVGGICYWVPPCSPVSTSGFFILFFTPPRFQLMPFPLPSRHPPPPVSFPSPSLTGLLPGKTQARYLGSFCFPAFTGTLVVIFLVQVHFSFTPQVFSFVSLLSSHYVTPVLWVPSYKQ